MKQILRAILSCRFYLVLACVLALPVGLPVSAYLFENWRGRRAWEEYRAAAEARGVKLGLDALETRPIPDAENFAAIPVFEEAFQYGEDSDGDVRRLRSFPRLDLQSHPIGGNGPERAGVDLGAWRDLFVQSGLVEDTGDSPAVAVLRALGSLEPELAQLREAATRPHCRFPVNWERGFGMTHPHFGVLRNAVVALTVRCAANLELGDSPAALASIREALGLYRSVANEPFLLFGLLRSYMLTLLGNAVWDGIARDRWPPEALRELQAEFSSLRPLGDYRVALKTERVASNISVDLMLARLPTGVSEIDSPPLWVRCLPKGWTWQGQRFINEIFDQKLARLEQDNLPWIEPDPTTIRLDEIRGSLIRRIYFVRTLILIPAFEKMDDIFLKAHIRAQQTAVACALQRSFQTSREYPESLDALVPTFLAAVPIDMLDGAPLRYRRTDDGKYTLWSIGVDRVDDHGKIDPKMAWSDQADWVWRP